MYKFWLIPLPINNVLNWLYIWPQLKAQFPLMYCQCLDNQLISLTRRLVLSILRYRLRLELNVRCMRSRLFLPPVVMYLYGCHISSPSRRLRGKMAEVRLKGKIRNLVFRSHIRLFLLPKQIGTMYSTCCKLQTSIIKCTYTLIVFMELVVIIRRSGSPWRNTEHFNFEETNKVDGVNFILIVRPVE